MDMHRSAASNPFVRVAYATTPADELRVAQRLLEQLLSDPLVLAYRKRMQRSFERGLGSDGLTDIAIQSPVDVIAEQRYLAARLVNPLASFTIHTASPDGCDMTDGVSAQALRLGLARAILGAVPFLWRQDIAMAAVQSQLPQHRVTFDDMPYATMYWTYERAVRMSLVDPDSDRQSPGPWIDCELVQRLDDWLLVARFGSWPGKGPAILLSGVRSGVDYPQDATERTALAELAFLRSEFIETVRLPGVPRNRNARKRLKASAALPPVRFVQLRSDVEKARRGDLSPSDARTTEWHVRWLVRGHYRRQWYPSVGLHRVKWIPPYLKGPADRPFRPPLYAVDR